MKISIQENNIQYSDLLKSFFINGKDVRFATTYELENEKTGKTKTFEFFESTGSEWDVNTIWIYKSEDGFTLEVGNEEVTKEMINNYLDAKIR